MILRKWEDLPHYMKNEDVRKYYDILKNRKGSLVLKRVFDLVAGTILFILLLPIFMLISIAIKVDSKGPVMFRQVRATQYGKQFKIFKFRTMVNNADKIGSQVTTKNDSRVTKIGKLLRKLRLDETPQLLNILTGDMTFVGTRPEVIKYVEEYTDEMCATLLLPAGVTSEASIQYKDEEKLLENTENADDTYINEVLPEKMKYNLKSIDEFSFINEIKTLLRTVGAVIGKENKDISIKVQNSNPRNKNYNS